MIIRDNFEIVANDNIVVKVPFKFLKDRGLLVRDNFIVIPILGNPNLPIQDNGIIRLPILGNDSDDFV